MSNSYSLRGRRPSLDDEINNSSSNSSSSLNRQSNNNSNRGHIDKKPKYQDNNSNNNASCVIYLGNIPKDWNDDIISSVVKGSGKIVDIRARIDPSGRTKNFCFIEYLEPFEAQRAMRLLSEIRVGENRKLRVELSKEGLRASNSTRNILQLQRNHLPYYVKLPLEMLEDDENPQQLQQQPPSFNPPQIKQEIEIPEILSNASKFLPPFNSSTFTSNEKISQNLSTIPPLQMIELLSTLKQLTNTNNISDAQRILNVNQQVPIAVVQTLLLMGLIDKNVLDVVMQSSETLISPSSTAPPPPPPPPPLDSRWPNLSNSTVTKLLKLNENEALMIGQVLNLNINDINNLPIEQRKVVESIRSQYL
ncbi:hypothetical protein WICMUC_005142 [Wickerhamomyces mucosus]|uniref:RRM domain-containing protein n=1 Tax=Wickerhamomyces mucosus TaxID=1378264 RepID=A0A9P8PAJ2_9ASCO|nr:hypothetical protein WICMUC_005142 [Wickerhamomyces mucosus]